MNDMQLVPVVAGCVIEKVGKYLLVQERLEKVYGKWNLPAGKVDVGETIEEAAVREAREETGYDVSLGAKLRVEHHDIARPVLHSYSATITGGELTVQENELLDARWFSLEEIRTMHAEGQLRADWVLHSVEDAARRQHG